MEAITKSRFDVSNPDIDSDHRTLARLLEELELVCKYPAAPDCQCDSCPDRKADSCHRLLGELGSKMQALLLDHFEREHELMNSLPPTPAVKKHCTRHRREHVSFSTQYNLAVARLNPGQPAIGARSIETLVFEWIRSHALEYDSELAALLNR